MAGVARRAVGPRGPAGIGTSAPNSERSLAHPWDPWQRVETRRCGVIWRTLRHDPDFAQELLARKLDVLPVEPVEWFPGVAQSRGRRYGRPVLVVRSLLLFVVAAIAEIGGAWLVWQGWREGRGAVWIGAGMLALGAYGFVATFQPDAQFGRVLAAYGGIFVVGSLLWGAVADGYRPDRFDLVGAALCLVGMAVMMYAPRS